MIVLHIISGLSNGGAEGVLYRLCKHDIHAEHTVVSLMDGGKYGPLLMQAGVNVHYLNMGSGRVSISGLFRLFRLIRHYKPDVVQTWMYHADLVGGLLAKVAGVRSIFWNVRHTTFRPGTSKKATILVANICAALSSWIPRRILYCALEAKFVHERLGYAASKAVIIENGFDLTQFETDNNARNAFREQLNLAPQEILIGMVGRFDPQKDHENLMKSLRVVKEAGYRFKLCLIGKGINFQQAELIAQITQNNLTPDVFLLGERADIPAVMNGIDLHVLASSFGEAFPNVLAEAMACGTPNVATDVGDAKSIIGETGEIVKPNMPEALARSIIKLLEEKLSNPNAWSQRKNMCRNRIANCFSIEKMVDRYHETWLDR